MAPANSLNFWKSFLLTFLLILPLLFLTDLLFHQDVWRGAPNSFAGVITVLFFSATWALIIAALVQVHWRHSGTRGSDSIPKPSREDGKK
jgi:hypothetical protein